MDFKLIASNQKAYRDFNLLEKIECGIALSGAEVKSLRLGFADFKGSFARMENEGKEIFLHNLHINPYEHAGLVEQEPLRKRRLLLHKNEIERLNGKVTQRGLQLVPTRIYFNKRGLAKVEIAVAQGKKLYDKRDDIKERSVNRTIQRALKQRKR